MDKITIGTKLYDFMLQNMKNHVVFEKNPQFYTWAHNLLMNNKQKIIDIELVSFLNKENKIILSKIPELLKYLLKTLYKMCYNENERLIKNYLINITLYAYFSIIDLFVTNESDDHKEINLLGFNLILLIYNDIFTQDKYIKSENCYNDLDDYMTYIYNPDSF